MKLLNDLFSTDYGLMSIIGIDSCCAWPRSSCMFVVKMNEPPAPNPAQVGKGNREGQTSTR